MQTNEIETILIQENFRQFLLQNNLARHSCIYHPGISTTPNICGCVGYYNRWITYDTDERGHAYCVENFDNIISALDNMLKKLGVEFDLYSYQSNDPIILLNEAKNHFEMKLSQYEGKKEFTNWFTYKLSIINDCLQSYENDQNKKVHK